MNGLIKAITLALTVVASVCAQAIEIVISEGWDSPTKIAVVPFGGPPLRDRPGPVPPLNVADIVSFDLMRSGQFDALPSDNMLSLPTTSEEVFFRDWRILGMDYVVIGRAELVPDGRIAVTYSLFDVNSEREIKSTTWTATAAQLRDIGHWIADEVYAQLTGVRGAFATKIVYVLVENPATPYASYRLTVADADGERERVVYQSNQPILSPSWSPDGRRLAYVSFRDGTVHHRRPGDRHRRPSPRGGVPGHQWGAGLLPRRQPARHVAVARRQLGDLHQGLDHREIAPGNAAPSAIDTEPAWGPNGDSIIFTSDRGGQPQIYRVDLATSLPERLTFEGDYKRPGPAVAERSPPRLRASPQPGLSHRLAGSRTRRRARVDGNIAGRVAIAGTQRDDDDLRHPS